MVEARALGKYGAKFVKGRCRQFQLCENVSDCLVTFCDCGYKEAEDCVEGLNSIDVEEAYGLSSGLGSLLKHRYGNDRKLYT